MDIVIRILRNLLKKWYYFLALSVVSAAAIFYLTRNEAKKYMSEGKVLINLQNNKGISLSDEKMKPLEVITFFNNLIELSKSMKIIEQLKFLAVRDRILDQHTFLPEIPVSDWGFTNEEFVAALNNKINDAPGQLKDSTISKMDYFLFENGLTASTIQNALKIYRIGGSYFMKVEVTTHNPQLSEYLANHFIHILKKEHKNSSKKSIQNHRAIIEELVKKSKAELDKKIDELESYKVKNNIINLGEHTKAIVNYIVELEKRKTHVLSSIAVHESSKNQVMEKLSGDHELMPNTDSHEEIMELKASLENLQQEHRKSHLSNEIDGTDLLEQVMQEHQNSIKNNLLAFSNEVVYDPSQVQLNLAFRYLDHDIGVTSYKDELEVLHDEMARVDRYSSKFAPFESTIVTLDKEIETARKTYLLMLNKLNLTESLHYGSGENIIEMIDKPKVPVKPLPSKRMILVAASGLGTFILLSAGLVFGLLLDRTIQTATQFERESNLPLVAAYPKELENGADQNFQLTVESIIRNQHAKVCHKIIDGGSKAVMITTNHVEEELPQMIGELQECFTQLGYKALVINSLVKSENGDLNIESDQLEIDSSKIYSKHLELGSIIDNDDRYDFILILVSPISKSSDVHFWRQFTRHIVHMHPAGKVYDQVDKRTEKLLLSEFNVLATGLYNLSSENVEDFLGEVPKRRSWIKRKIKSLLKGQLL